MLRLENVSGGYREKQPVLNGIDLEVREKETVAIIGQNGAGKSTLIKAIMNMLPIVNGNIYFKGEDLRKKTTQGIVNQGIGYFIQGGRIFPHLSVEENLNFAGKHLRKTERSKRKEELKSNFELFKNYQNDRSLSKASYLSGGEQHQLALAMVLMRDPDLLILDEPSAGLSPVNTKILYDTLNKIRSKNSISILLIEQNIHFANEFSDIMLLLQQGTIVQRNISLNEIENLFFNTNKAKKGD